MRLDTSKLHKTLNRGLVINALIKMVKKCGFCKVEIAEEEAFEVCARCGQGIWGDKMFQTIRANMNGAKSKGNLYQGSVSS